MHPLDRKLLRNLWRIKGQAAAISLVIGLGVMMLVMMSGLVNTLDETRRAYYDRYRLAEIFAPATRVPAHMMAELAAIPGVRATQGRISGIALIDPGTGQLPARAQMLSLPDTGPPRLNDIYLNAGRLPEPAHHDEALVLDGFAQAHGLRPGDQITVTLNGARRVLRISGLAQSPEFLYTTPPGEMVPDEARFAVFWMRDAALAAAYDLRGTFNEALLALSPGADQRAVIDSIDRILAPYGGRGAYGIDDLPSNRYVSEEIAGLSTMATTVPPVFLAVAAFLLYIVTSRIVRSEREQIGLLKAFGYSGLEISLHYLKFVLIIALAGAAFGAIGGILAGRAMAGVFQIYFKFPFIVFLIEPQSIVIGFVISVLAAAAGSFFVLRQVFALTPAVAMQPPAPSDYSAMGAFGALAQRLLDQPTRMVLRRLRRYPGRMLGATIGLAAGMALSVASLAVLAGFNVTLAQSFSVVDRSDATISFITPVSDSALYALRQFDGIHHVEPVRIVPAVLHHGRHSYRGAVDGLVEYPQLNRVLAPDGAPLAMRRDGIILAEPLAELLNIRPGQTLRIEVLQGHRPVIEIPVVGLAQTLMGAPAFMEIEALNRALREPGRISAARLSYDPLQEPALIAWLKDTPTVAAISIKANTRAAFEQVMNTGAGMVRYVMVVIAGAITFGIVYNAARIAFAERQRDLAHLRVMGFTRGETAFVLLGELGVVVLLALPLGSALGYGLTHAMAAGFSNDLYQIRATYSAPSHGAAALAVLLAAGASALLVKRGIDRLDLVAALKSKE